MRCKGCYKEVKEGYCLSCRKRLFDARRIPPVLPFEAPNPSNLNLFQEHSKRMSISGVQLKYSLRLEEDQLTLCETGAQYILKPAPLSEQLASPDDVPENEHLTMQIAEQLFGIQVASNALIYFRDGIPAYITKRFDIGADGHKYMQEDFAQLTSRSKETHGDAYKYDGSYEEIGQLIRRFVAASAPTLEKFFKQVVFNYIISNGDAHLRNFSLIRTDAAEYQLTSAYDLISTVLHTPGESDTALDLYDKDIDSEFYAAYGYYGRANFMELAKRLGIVDGRAARIMDQFSAKEGQMRAFVERSFLSDAAKGQYISNVVDKLKRI